MPDTLLPLPEAFSPHRWIIGPGRGSCDPVKRTLKVPLDDTTGSRFIRNHELGHALITPRHYVEKQCKKYEITHDALQVCEDLRVHLFLRKKGVERPGNLDDDDALAHIEVFKDKPRQLITSLVATLHTDDYERLTKAIRHHCGDEACAYLEHCCDMIAQRMSGARNLFRPIGFRNGTVPAARLLDALFPLEPDTQQVIPNAALVGGMNGRIAKWGHLEIKHVPVSQTRSVRRLGNRRVFTDEGVHMSAVHRLPVDGRIFARKRKVLGGTFLIDVSGSMNLSHDDLLTLMRIAPAATLAVYCGRKKSGRLTVVGKDGRLATPDAIREARIGQGNVVDGPALEWLAKQDSPRMWISDGQVTGVLDRSHPDLATQALRICQRARIQRMHKLQPGETS